jgi:hypothetical protein
VNIYCFPVCIFLLAMPLHHIYFRFTWHMTRCGLSKKVLGVVCNFSILRMLEILQQDLWKAATHYSGIWFHINVEPFYTFMQWDFPRKAGKVPQQCDHSTSVWKEMCTAVKHLLPMCSDWLCPFSDWLLDNHGTAVKIWFRIIPTFCAPNCRR